MPNHETRLGVGSHGDINITGVNPNTGTGLHVHVPKGKEAHFGTIKISNVMVPVIKTGFGVMRFDGLITQDFGGDNFNIRGDGNVVGDTIEVVSNSPTRPYNRLFRQGNETVAQCLLRHGEIVLDPSLLEFEIWQGKQVIHGYHVDAIMQMYATPEVGYPVYDDKIRAPDGSYGLIQNIRVPHILANMRGKNTQGIMGSERCTYKDIHLGTKTFKVKNEGYEYHTVFNTLTDSVIGCTGLEVPQGCKLKVLDVKNSGGIIGNNRYPGFKENEIIGDKTTMSIQTMEFTTIPPIDIRQWCFERDVEISKVEAIIAQESGFSKDALLYERHVMYRELEKKGIDPDKLVKNQPEYKYLIQEDRFIKYGKYKEQRPRFEMVKKVDHECAIKSCSWGFAQVMGFNWEMCGFLSAYDFEHAMGSEDGQMFAFLNYLENREGMLDALRKGQTSRMKVLYNGPAIRDLDNDGMDDWEQGYIKHHNRILASQAPRRTVGNAFKRSRTLKKQINSGGTKLLSASGLAALGLTLEQAEGILKSASEVTEKAREKVEASKTQVDVIVDNITTTVDTIIPSAAPSFSYMPNIAFCLAGMVIAGLFFNYKAIIAYLEDNGFIKPKVKFRDPTKHHRV